jgi:hypothetical protein
MPAEPLTAVSMAIIIVICFAIAFAWLYYLRMIDLFEREKI